MKWEQHTRTVATYKQVNEFFCEMIGWLTDKVVVRISVTVVVRLADTVVVRLAGCHGYRPAGCHPDG